jgi:hypothetical protein
MDLFLSSYLKKKKKGSHLVKMPVIFYYVLKYDVSNKAIVIYMTFKCAVFFLYRVILNDFSRSRREN